MRRGIYVNYRTVSGLRTRFFPKSRIGQGLISMAPWVNILLLIILFVLLDTKLVVQPGRVVELPDVPFFDGTRSLMTAVVVAGQTAVPADDVVFFDDVPYSLGKVAHVDMLRNALSRYSARHADADLVIQADHRASYGTVMKLIEMARAVGIARVNLASRQTVTAVTAGKERVEAKQR